MKKITDSQDWIDPKQMKINKGSTTEGSEYVGTEVLVNSVHSTDINKTDNEDLTNSEQKYLLANRKDSQNKTIDKNESIFMEEEGEGELRESTYSRKKYRETHQKDLMSDFQAMTAILKGYCAINILILPKNFENGGWAVGIGSMVMAGILIYFCAIKLVQCAQKIDIFAYRDVAEHALGSKAAEVIDVCVGLCQLSFTVAQISFTLKALQSIITVDGKEVDLWWFAIGIIVVYSPLAWVRRISFWANFYTFAIAMIVYTSFVVGCFSAYNLITQGRINVGFQAINTDKMWDMVGFSFYCFEGIGVLLPIMRESRNPTHFPQILKLCLVILTVYFCVFAMLCYAWFGNMKEPIVINNMKPNWFIDITKILYCINLVFSYPLTIFPTNRTFERIMFGRMEESLAKIWIQNLSRTCWVVLGCFMSIFFESTIDEFLGISGSLLGIPIILIVPTLCHYVLIAKTKAEKGIDIAIIIFGVGICGLCSSQSISKYIEELQGKD